MYYVGLDVSQKLTAICIVDNKGKVIAEGKILTLPSDIYSWVTTRLDGMGTIVKVGLETGAMSNWLCHELTQLGLPMVCLEAFQAHRFLEAHRNKTDRNDARGLAQLVRMGEAFIKPVTIRSQASQETRAALALRQQLVKQKTAVENTIGGIFKAFGLIVQRGHLGKGTFQRRVVEKLCEAEIRGINLREAVTSALALHQTLEEQITVLTR